MTMDPIQADRAGRTRDLLKAANGRIDSNAKEAMYEVLATTQAAAEPNLPLEERMERGAKAMVAVGDLQVRMGVAMPKMIDEHAGACAIAHAAHADKGYVLSWEAHGPLPAGKLHGKHAIIIAVAIFAWVGVRLGQSYFSEHCVADDLAKVTRSTAAVLATKTEAAEQGRAEAADAREERIIRAVRAAIAAEIEK